jgi:hypothetical protein
VNESHAIDVAEAPQDADSYLMEDTFMNTEVDAPPENDPSVNVPDRLYAAYVDAVLADNAPFYQVSNQIFVVSGWNAQEGCNNVRWPEFVHSSI